MSTITRLLPGSNRNLHVAILHAKETMGAVEPQDMAITTGVRDRINVFAAPFGTAIETVNKALGNQVEKTAEKDMLMNISLCFEKDFIKHLNANIKRSELTGDGLFSRADRAYYHLMPEQDTLPKITTEAEVMIWGKYLLEGEQQRIAAGKTPMTQPALAEFATWVLRFRDANNEQTNLKNIYDNALQALEDLKPTAIMLVKDIWDDAENFYRHLEPESKRRKCREWGVVYITRENKKSCDITGEVRNPTGMPLENVHIEIPSLGRYVNTNIEGNYEFTDVQEGKYTVTFTKEGYQSVVMDDVEIVFDQPNVLNVVMNIEILE